MTTAQHFTTHRITNQSTRLDHDSYGNASQQDRDTNDTYNRNEQQSTTGYAKKSNVVATTTDYSTLGRLKKNINELGSMIDDMDTDEMDHLDTKYLGQARSMKHVDVRKTSSEGNINTCTDLEIGDDSKDTVWFGVPPSCPCI